MRNDDPVVDMEAEVISRPRHHTLTASTVAYYPLNTIPRGGGRGLAEGKEDQPPNPHKRQRSGGRSSTVVGSIPPFTGVYNAE